MNASSADDLLESRLRDCARTLAGHGVPLDSEEVLAGAVIPAVAPTSTCRARTSSGPRAVAALHGLPRPGAQAEGFPASTGLVACFDDCPRGGKVRRIAEEIDAQDLIERAAALPGARRSTAREPIAAAAVVAEVEVAWARAGDEAALRRAWRDRHGGGAMPLLLLSDEFAPAGQVAVVGPTEHMQSLRRVGTSRLLEVVRGIADMPRLQAVRELASELERLDEAGIPGLKVRELLTDHTLEVRLRRDDQRWQTLVDQAAAIPEGAEWQEALRALGYDLERRRDYGWLTRHNNRPVAVIHPKKDPTAFSRPDQDGRPPVGYARMTKRERELEAEIVELKEQAQALLAAAEETDAAEDARHGAERRGDELPEELARRESRLATIRAAKEALEAEAAEAAAERERDKARRRARRQAEREAAAAGASAEAVDTAGDRAEAAVDENPEVDAAAEQAAAEGA